MSNEPSHAISALCESWWAQLADATKTEQHSGAGVRIVPLFPELVAPLQDAFDAAPEGEVFVLPRLKGGSNLRTTFYKIIARAGLEPFPKPWVNLRASRAVELAREHPAHVAARWVLRRPFVASAIIGAKRPEQVADNAGAIGWDLDEDELDLIDELTARVRLR